MMLTQFRYSDLANKYVEDVDSLNLTYLKRFSSNRNMKVNIRYGRAYPAPQSTALSTFFLLLPPTPSFAKKFFDP